MKESPTLLQKQSIRCETEQDGYNREDIFYPVATVSMRDCTTILKSCYNDEGISYPVATQSVGRSDDLMISYNDEGISYPAATERQQNRFVKLQW